MNIYILDLSLLHLSELFSNSFIEKIFLKLKIYGEKSTNFKITKLCSTFLTVSGYVYFFALNTIRSALCGKQHSLFDARDINKSKHIYFYKSSVRFTAVSAFLLVVHFIPVGWSILPQTKQFCMIMIVRYHPKWPFKKIN